MDNPYICYNCQTASPGNFLIQMYCKGSFSGPRTSNHILEKKHDWVFEVKTGQVT